MVSAESVQIMLPIISVLLLVLGFRNSIYGVISYFIILVTKIGDIYPTLGAMRYEAVAALIVFISILLNGRGLASAFNTSNAIVKSVWVLFIVGMLSVPQAIDVQMSWYMGGYMLLKLVLFFIMIVASIKDRDDIAKLQWALFGITAWIAYEPVTNYLSGIGREHRYGLVAAGRFGVAAGHVALANTLNQSLPVMLSLLFAEMKRFQRVLLALLVMLCVTGVVVSKSRGGFLGLVAVVLGTILVKRGNRKVAVLLIACLLAVVALAGESYTSHMSTISDGVFASRSTSDRYLGLVNGISMMMKRPLLGVGIGCYAEARSRYFRYYFYAHNLYGEIIGELGIGSLAWFFFVYSMFKSAAALKREAAHDPGQNQAVALLSGIQVALLVRLVIGNFSHGAFIWFWFLMAGLLVGVDQTMRQEHVSSDAESGVAAGAP